MCDIIIDSLTYKKRVQKSLRHQNEITKIIFRLKCALRFINYNQIRLYIKILVISVDKIPLNLLNFSCKDQELDFKNKYEIRSRINISNVYKSPETNCDVSVLNMLHSGLSISHNYLFRQNILFEYKTNFHAKKLF